MLALSVEIRSEKEETDKAVGAGGLKPFCYNFTKMFSKVLTTSYGFPGLEYISLTIFS